MRKESRRRLAGVTIAAVLSAGGPAVAQSFEGPYFGGVAGYGMTEADVQAGSTTASALSATGATGGVFFGVASRVRSDRALLVGMEVDYAASRGDARLVTSTESLEIDPGRTIGVSGLVGVSLVDRVQVYGKLGYANTEFGGLGGGDFDLDGFRFGGGGEFAVSEFWTFRSELLRVEYGSSGQGGHFDPAQTSVTAGFRYSF